MGRLKTMDVVERNDAAVMTEDATEYRYDLVGILDQVETHGGLISDYDYDNLNRLTKIVEFRDVGGQANAYDPSVDALLADYVYTVRADGKRTRAVERTHLNTDAVLDQTTIDWAYDELGRLVGIAYDSVLDNSLDAIARYQYDLASNRTAHKVDCQPSPAALDAFRTNGAFPAAFDETTTYVHDANDRLLTEISDKPISGDDRHITYAYGPGNTRTHQTSKTVRYSTTGAGDAHETHTFDYDEAGGMKQSVVFKNGVTTTNAYKSNDDGVRVVQTETVSGVSGTTTTVYHIDPQNPTGYAKPIEESENGAITRIYGMGLQIVSQAKIGSDAGVHFFLYDGHGRTRALASSAVQIVERYAYDAFGRTLAGTGLTMAANTKYSFRSTRSSASARIDSNAS